MAREYSAVRPMSIEPPVAEWGDLCRHVARLGALLSPLEGAQNGTVRSLAGQAIGAVGQMRAQIDAMQSGACDVEAEQPYAKSYGDLLRQALLANAQVCEELYRRREGTSLAAQLPYLTSLAHYVHSLLLTLAAF